jgi:hypothetical protein
MPRAIGYFRIGYAEELALVQTPAEYLKNTKGRGERGR